VTRRTRIGVVAAAAAAALVAAWQLVVAVQPSAAPLPAAMVATTVAPVAAGPTDLTVTGALAGASAPAASPAVVTAATMKTGTVLVPSAGIYTTYAPEPVVDGQAVIPATTTGMWSGGARPSDTAGTVLMWAHVEHAFAGLYQAVPHGVVYVRDETGRLSSWQITRIYTEPRSWTHPDLYTATGPHQLALVTCGGPVSWGHYTQNTIVIAQEVRS